MRSTTKRLLWAASLSCVCFAANYVWFKSTEKTYHASNEAPIAQVSKIGDEVLRRPSTRLLWQALNTGDNLYTGETIRTSPRGELRIQFEDGRYIDLEPESLIVLQKSKGEIALDLMEGSLFVNAADADKDAAAKGKAPGLVLNSKNGKIDLTGASASLSKGSGDSVDLQVLQGKATIQGADGKSKEVEGGSSTSLGQNGTGFSAQLVKMLSPQIGKPYFVDPNNLKPVPFKWTGFPEQWKVSVHIGPSRKELKEWIPNTSVKNSTGEAQLPLGKYFYKLVATDPQSNKVLGESSVYKLDLQARYAPTAIFPQANQNIPVEKAPFDLTFKWQRSDESARVVLEITKDKQMQQKVFSKTFTREEEFTFPQLTEGEYYWRVSGIYDSENQPISGQLSKFVISKSKLKKDPVQIVWTVPDKDVEQYFLEKPKLNISWEPKNRKEEIVRYRIKLEPEQGTNEEMTNLEVKTNNAQAELAKPGRYLASVEAIDNEGAVIGESEKKTLAALQVPKLGTTQIIPAEGILKSNDDGHTELTWQPLDGAKEYWIQVKNKEGKEIARKKYQSNSTHLRNLMPGEYFVSVTGVDQYGRDGATSTDRTLVVPNKSSVKAPKLKKIKVN